MSIQKIIDRSYQFFLGEDKILSNTIYEANGVTPIDISGWEIWFVMRESIDAPTALITKKTTDVSNGITITNGPAGQLEIAFADTDTDGSADTLKAGTAYHYSVKRLNAGVEQILTFGTLTFAGTTQQ